MPTDFKEWLAVVQFLWLVGLSLAMWLRKPGEEAAAAVKALADELRSRIDEQARRLTEVETHMEHMPTSEELAELEGTVKQIDERTESLADGMRTVRASLQRIEDFLLKR